MKKKSRWLWKKITRTSWAERKRNVFQEIEWGRNIFTSIMWWESETRRGNLYTEVQRIYRRGESDRWRRPRVRYLDNIILQPLENDNDGDGNRFSAGFSLIRRRTWVRPGITVSDLCIPVASLYKNEPFALPYYNGRCTVKNQNTKIKLRRINFISLLFYRKDFVFSFSRFARAPGVQL